MIKRTLTIALMLFAFSAMAQQDAAFSQYFFNPLYVNPGYAGSREVLSGVAIYRNQWVGINGSPETESFSLHGPLRDKRVGLGIQLYHDKAGPLQNTGLLATYAYWIPLGKYKLSLGLQGTIYHLRVDWDEINVEDKTDEAFSGNNAFKIIPDANFGAYFHGQRFYLGASVVHLIENKFKLDDFNRDDVARFFRHYYLMSGVVFKVSQNTDFRPSILMKYVNAAPLDMEANACFIFYEKFFIGAGWRTSQKSNLSQRDNQIVGILEYTIANRWRIGYSYDLDLNELHNYNSGTHEIMVGFDLDVLKTRMLCPRFF